MRYESTSSARLQAREVEERCRSAIEIHLQLAPVCKGGGGQERRQNYVELRAREMEKVGTLPGRHKGPSGSRLHARRSGQGVSDGRYARTCRPCRQGHGVGQVLVRRGLPMLCVHQEVGKGGRWKRTTYGSPPYAPGCLPQHGSPLCFLTTPNPHAGMPARNPSTSKLTGLHQRRQLAPCSGMEGLKRTKRG
jgi:hypothetical protein